MSNFKTKAFEPSTLHLSCYTITTAQKKKIYEEGYCIVRRSCHKIRTAEHMYGMNKQLRPTNINFQMLEEKHTFPMITYALP
jgi:hypothetical protein